MKFFSKFSNYRVVLVSALPAEPVTGRQPQPGVYAKFENGECTINDEKVIDMMLTHKDFGRDFVTEESGEQGRFASARKGIEPQHDVINIDYGHIGKNVNPKKTTLTEEQQNFLKSAAQEMAVPLAKEMAAQMLKDIAAEQAAIKKDAPPVASEKKETVTTKKSFPKKK